MSPELEGLLASTVAAFRLGMDAQANDALARLIDGLLAALAQDPPRARAVAPLVAELVRCQERGDTLALADLLSSDLARALGG